MIFQHVDIDEKIIVENFMDMKKGTAIDFQKISEILFDWSGKWIEKKIEKIK